MKQRVSFYTFGCRLNQSETASLRNSFKANSTYQVVDHVSTADIVVINTCTVTQSSDTDTRHLVHKVNRLNPAARIALVGCQAQVQKEQLAALPNVRWIVGNGRKMDLVAVFDEYPDPQAAAVITPVMGREAFSLPVASIDGEHTRANIKIQDGCDFFCSFCEIPFARGRARSRVFEDILTESQALIAAGHQELILTGINIGTYADQGKTLVDVVAALEGIKGLQRVRISSIEPTTIADGLIDAMSTGHKLCRYLHIPLQNGDNEILAAMKRKYTVEEFGDFVSRAEAKVPQMCIGTDVMVGFPGESDRHFERTVELLKELPIHYFHVFGYSPRQTAQSRLMPAIAPRVIHERSAILRELSGRKRHLFQESILGTIQQVLFEKPKGDGWQNGLTDNYVRVKVKGSTNLFNQILPVRLQRIDGQALEGELL
jgi:threonylcarbamoyladenosine tRNA methylthiotransferase MtaB